MTDNSLLALHKKEDTKSQDCQDFVTLTNNRKPNLIPSNTRVENVLISKLIDGDYPSFTYIFTSYYHDLVLFASKFTHDLDNAEEIVQDTFVKIWENHKSINIEISLKSYLLKSVHNKCIDWHRHRKIMKVHKDSAFQNSCPFECGIDSYILSSELQDKIEKVLRTIPCQLSEAFRMNRYNGFKYYEIADILGVSIRTIEVRIGKTLQILRDNLKEYFVIVIIAMTVISL